MSKPHFVILKNSDENPEIYSMKAWFRENPQSQPIGFDAIDKTSHQIRRALVRNGWEMEELSDRVLLIKSDENGDVSFADPLLDNASKTEDNESDDITEALEVTFGLERDLQTALRNNIKQLDPSLVIIDDGKERVTDAGRIDITAEDSKGNIVIIELKAGVAQAEVIAQILAYMGAVAENDNKPVRGIIVASDFHKRVVWAARAIPNLELRKYSFQFIFEPIN